MKWFRHDSSAHTDAKLQKVLMKFGAEGYAIYWYCLELIAGKVDTNHITFELEHDAEIIGFTLKIDQIRVEEIMAFMCQLKLFERNNGMISCLKMAYRLDDTNSRNPMIRTLIEKIQIKTPNTEESRSIPKYPEASRSIPKHPEDPPTNFGQTRLDEIRLDKKRIHKEKKVGFQPPSSPEVQKYLDKQGITGFTGNDFVNHYSAIGWMLGKNKIKSWQHCISSWTRNTPEKKVSLEILD